MRSLKHLFFTLIFFSVGTLIADEVVWEGTISSNGTPSKAISLTLKETYLIRASGLINLGKWVQAGQKLANDACFEFSSEEVKERIESLKNSLDISICDGEFHADHVYTSKPFVAKHNRIHFWVLDTDYDDNSGNFKVEILKKN